MEQEQPMNPVAASLIRTLVPLVAGVLIAWAANAGLDLHGELVTAVLTGAASAAYYAGARVLEHFASSRWGWLLGVPRAPVYPPKPAPVPAAPAPPAPVGP